MKRIGELVQKLGHQRLINTQDGGRDGFKLPPVVCDDGRMRPFIVDCMVRHKMGAMIAFEVDLNHETTRHKKTILARFGIVTIPVSPSDVDEWVKDLALLEQEIEYHLNQMEVIAC